METRQPAADRKMPVPLNLETVLLEVARILREEDAADARRVSPPQRAAA
jgi:hypothetical protein